MVARLLPSIATAMTHTVANDTCCCNGCTVAAVHNDNNDSYNRYQLEDQKIRDAAIRHLKTASEQIEAKAFGNFFIGAGFHKPHVPWIFPEEFLQFYPQDLADIPLANDTYAPVAMPPYAWHFPADVQGMDIKANGTVCGSNA